MQTQYCGEWEGHMVTHRAPPPLAHSHLLQAQAGSSLHVPSESHLWSGGHNLKAQFSGAPRGVQALGKEGGWAGGCPAISS